MMTFINLLSSWKQYFLIFCYRLAVVSLDVYFFIKDKLVESVKTQFEYKSTYHYDDFNVCEYTINVYNQQHDLYFLEFEYTNSDCDIEIIDYEYDFLQFKKTAKEDDIKFLIDKKNHVLYCGIICDEDQFYFDCTEYLRKFCFYFDQTTDKVTWKMILEHITLIQNINLETEKYKLVLYKNDDELTESEYIIDSKFLNQKFALQL